MVYVRDVANVADGSIPQTNIVRQDGHRGVLITVLKSGSASTLGVVQGVLNLLPRVKSTLPSNLKITPIGNQAIFVRGSVNGVIREAVIAAALTGLMILLFLGSWRSTLIIAVSIPLSILTSIIILGLLGETINIMTLGGLALAVGILVDDATVTIENIERYLEEGPRAARRHPRRRGADLRSRAGLHALHLHRVPADVLPVGRGALSVRSAGGGRRLRHAGVLRALAHPGAHAGDVSAQGARPRRAALAQSAGPLSARLRARASSASAPAIESLLERLVAARELFIPVFLGLLRRRPAADPVPRPELLPLHRQRLVHPARARQDRHPHRGDRAALRPGRADHPRHHPARRRWTTSSTTSACPTPR